MNAGKQTKAGRVRHGGSCRARALPPSLSREMTMWGRGDGLAGEGAKTLGDEGVGRISVVLAFG